jgi:hypothetical protein
LIADTQISGFVHWILEMKKYFKQKDWYFEVQRFKVQRFSVTLSQYALVQNIGGGNFSCETPPGRNSEQIERRTSNIDGAPRPAAELNPEPLV